MAGRIPDPAYLKHDPGFCDTTREILARMADQMYAHYMAETAPAALQSDLLHWCEMLEGECKTLYRTELLTDLPEFDSAKDVN